MKIILNNTNINFRRCNILPYIQVDKRLYQVVNGILSNSNWFYRQYDVRGINSVKIVVPSYTDNVTGLFTMFVAFRNNDMVDCYEHPVTPTEELETLEINTSQIDTIIVNIPKNATNESYVEKIDANSYELIQSTEQVIGAWVDKKGVVNSGTGLNYVMINVENCKTIDIVASGMVSNGIPMWVGVKDGVFSSGHYDAEANGRNPTKTTLDVSNYDVLYVNSLNPVKPSIYK